jgi:hypothetical protein
MVHDLPSAGWVDLAAAAGFSHATVMGRSLDA